MSIRNWPETERPREKLLSQGPDILSDAELLAIFLGSGPQGLTALDLARELLIQYKSLTGLLDADAEGLCQFTGVGPAKYTLLQAALELGRRHLQSKLSQQNILENPEATREYLQARIGSHKREVFGCLFLSSQYHVICFKELFYGSINCTHIHPREVVKSALQYNAAAVILAHNHPSGTPDPSEEDCQITNHIIKALSLVEVKVLDHVVIGQGETTSMAELGLLYG